MKLLIPGLIAILTLSACSKSIGKSAGGGSVESSSYQWTWTSTAEVDGRVTVTLNPPADILKKMEDCVYSVGWFGASGVGLNVDWGDGRTEPQFSHPHQGLSCTNAVRKHVYTASGEFTVKIKSWHPGPTDAPITDWEGSAVIKINLKSSPSSALYLTTPPTPSVFQYQQLPEIKWYLRTPKKVDIRAEYVSADNLQPFFTKTITGVAYTGEGSAGSFAQNWDAYDALLRAGKDKFFIRVTVLDQGQVVDVKAGGDFTMSGLFVSPNTPLVAQDPQDLTRVSISYTVNHPVCFAYDIDWGDGIHETSAQGMQPNCPLAPEVRTFTHKYSGPGHYVIKLKSNNLDPFKDFSSIVMYEGWTLDIQ